MLTRDILDQYLPDDDITRRLAEKITGLDLSTDLVDNGLVWMAKFTESDSFSGYGQDRPEWRDRIHDIWWPIEATGLYYKQRSHYLTAEGWPMNTTCWYVRVECGSREFVTAETTKLAVLRAICFIGAIIKWREIEPPKRPNRLLVLEEMRNGSR